MRRLLALLFRGVPPVPPGIDPAAWRALAARCGSPVVRPSLARPLHITAVVWRPGSLTAPWGRA